MKRENMSRRVVYAVVSVDFILRESVFHAVQD